MAHSIFMFFVTFIIHIIAILKPDDRIEFMFYFHFEYFCK